MKKTNLEQMLQQGASTLFPNISIKTQMLENIIKFSTKYPSRKSFREDGEMFEDTIIRPLQSLSKMHLLIELNSLEDEYLVRIYTLASDETDLS